MNEKMKYTVETAALPDSVLAAAAPLSDGRHIIVVNSQLSEDERQTAVREMIRHI